MRNQVISIVLAALLAGCGGVLPHESSVDSAKFETYEDVMAAYAKVDTGATRVADLTELGFDPKVTPNIEILSYVQIIEIFMPAEGITMQHLPKNVRACIDVLDRCSAYVVRLQHSSVRHNGSVVADLLEIQRDTTRVGWAAVIVLLMQDDRVVYKVVSARPNIEIQREQSQPLGPLQDLRKLITGGDGS